MIAVKLSRRAQALFKPGQPDAPGTPRPDKGIMRRAALYLLRLQAERLEAGLGSNNAALKPYSKGYAAYRASKGRSTDKRTLTFTGRMKAARGVKAVTDKTAVIGWPAGEEAAKALGNQRRTPFVRATPDEIKKVTEFIRAELRRKVRPK